MISKRTKLIAGIAAALCLLVVILVVLRGGSKDDRGGRGTPYPYSYQTQEDGTVRFSIRDKSAEEFHWVVTNVSQENIVVVSTPEIDGNETIITLTGLKEGSVSFSLSHQRKEAPISRDFVLEIGVQVHPSLQADVIGVQGKSLKPEKEETTATGYRYELTTDIRGAQVLHFYGPELWKCNWETLDYDDSILSVLPQVEEDGSYRVAISNVDLGETTLRVRGRPQTEAIQPGITFTCKIAVTADKGWVLSEEAFVEENIPLASEEEILEMKEIEEWLDAPLTVPEGARIDACGRTGLIGNTPGAIVYFSMNGKTWMLSATPYKSAAEMKTALAADGGMDIRQVVVDTTNIQIYSRNDESGNVEDPVTFWDDGSGITWMLSGRDATEESLQAMVKLVLQGQASAKSSPEAEAETEEN